MYETPIPQPPTPRKSWPRRHKILTALFAAPAALITLILVIALATGGSHTVTPAAAPATHVPAPPAQPAAPVATTPAAGPTMTRTVERVVFKVAGDGTPSIQYGTDADNTSASDGLGTLGDGNYLPWTAAMPFRDSALYWYVSAQLSDSGGAITCTVSAKVTGYFSDGTHYTKYHVMATGHASGQYQICQAETS